MMARRSEDEAKASGEARPPAPREPARPDAGARAPRRTVLETHAARGAQLPLVASARRTPWSGYWWSMQRGELVLGWDDGRGRRTWTPAEVLAFDACLGSCEERCRALMEGHLADKGARLSPLMKFDLWAWRWLEGVLGPCGATPHLVTRAARWEIEHHYIGDDAGHRHARSASYAGKCIGWALSTFDWDEPTTTRELLGVTFGPADIKGLLASIYNGAQFFVPDALWVGNTYHDVAGHDSQAFYDDVTPPDFVRALVATIGRGELLQGDLDPGDEVWNHPIHRYELEPGPIVGGRVQVRATFGYADDDVDIDGVFSTDPARPDLCSRTLDFELVLPRGERSLLRAVDGRWLGASVDLHPDSLILGVEPTWRRDIYQYRASRMREEVNFPLIKRFEVGASWTPLVDVLLAAYYA